MFRHPAIIICILACSAAVLRLHQRPCRHRRRAPARSSAKASTSSPTTSTNSATGPLKDATHGHDRARPAWHSERRLDRHAGQILGQYPPRRRLPRPPEPPERPDRRPASRRPLHLRSRLLDAVPLASARRRRRRRSPRRAGRRAHSWSTSPARPKRKPAAGATSAKDGGGFDEGSTTITQVQGLRGCRNAGIPVPKEIIDKAVQVHQENARCPTAACNTVPKGAADDPPSPPRPSPAYSTPAAIRRRFRSPDAEILRAKPHLG